MRVRWTAKARSDLVRLHAHLAPVNRRAAAGIVQTLRASAARLQYFPRLGRQVPITGQGEFRRVIVGDYEVRYVVQEETITILRIWHTREDR